MKRNDRGFLTKALMSALLLFVALPAVALAQGNSRHGRNKDVFVNGHDARDGRYDGRGPRRDDNWRRRRDRDYDEDDRYRRDDDYRYRRDRGRNDDYGYGNNGNYGYRDDFTQTALNAGYNAGIEQGRRDRGRGRYTDPRDSGAYRDADKDYNSRLGDRYTYQQYFRQGFINGYRDGLNGY